MSRSASSLSASNTAVYKSGAEFALPWVIDITFKHVQEFKKLFSKSELESLVQAHRDIRLEDSWPEKKFLINRIEAYFTIEKSVPLSTSTKTALLLKLRRLDDCEAVTLSVWARSFWYHNTQQSIDIETYIA